MDQGLKQPRAYFWVKVNKPLHIYPRVELDLGNESQLDLRFTDMDLPIETIR